MLSLGSFEFSVTTAAYQSLRRSSSYQWPQQERIRHYPGKQWVGPGVETITLDGTIYTACDVFGEAPGAHQMDKLRGLALRGFPQELMDGAGYYYGLFVIESVEETGTIFIAEGVPQKETFAVSLTRYVKDATLDYPVLIRGRASSEGGGGVSQNSLINLMTGRSDLRSANTGSEREVSALINIF